MFCVSIVLTHVYNIVWMVTTTAVKKNVAISTLNWNKHVEYWPKDQHQTTKALRDWQLIHTSKRLTVDIVTDRFLLAIVKGYHTAATKLVTDRRRPCVVLWAHSQRPSKGVAYLIYNCILLNTANLRNDQNMCILIKTTERIHLYSRQTKQLYAGRI